jgi:hypothetical protein
MDPERYPPDDTFAKGKTRKIDGRYIKAMWIEDPEIPTVAPQIVRIWGAVPIPISERYKQYKASPWYKAP